MFWIDHVGVVARDLDESVAFYTKLFGPPIDRVAWRGEHAANVARLMGRPPGLELDAVFFRIPHTNAIFEVVSFRGIEQAEVVAGNADIGATHFGFHVEDIEATVAQLGLEISGSARRPAHRAVPGRSQRVSQGSERGEHPADATRRTARHMPSFDPETRRSTSRRSDDEGHRVAPLRAAR